MTEEYVTYGHRLEPHIADTARLCWDALDAGCTVLFEGAQGTLLDLDHGTYPFVTSSNPIAGRGLRRRRGRPGRHRRGLGRGKGLRDPGRRGPVPHRARRRARHRCSGSAAASAGRRPAGERRCGWLDLVALRYAARLNRMTALVITKLDVLSGIDPLRVAVRYRHPEGARFDEFPYHQSILHTAEAEYEELPGFERRHRRVPQRGRAAAARRATTSTSCARTSGSRSGWWASGPGRDQVMWMGEAERHLRAA